MTYKVLPTPSKSNPQIKEYLKAVRNGRYSQFVVHNGTKWLVTNQGNLKDLSSSRSFSHKEQAIGYAKNLASKYKASVFVFDNKGDLIEHS